MVGSQTMASKINQLKSMGSDLWFYVLSTLLLFEFLTLKAGSSITPTQFI